MKNSDDKKDQPKKEPRCDLEQLELLKKCSEKKDMTEWNKWREENPKEEIWLQGAQILNAHLKEADLHGAHLEEACLSYTDADRANLRKTYLEGAYLHWAQLKRATLVGAHLERASLLGAQMQGAGLNYVHLEGAKLKDAHLEGSHLLYDHLEGVDLRGAHLEGADFTACSVDGLTLFWECSVDRKTDFRGVGLESCRIDEGTKYLLEYNRRRMNCEDWYKQHPRLACPAKAFFSFSDYGNSTWRIIQTFLIMATCFAIVYYIWGAVDYYLLGVTDHPGIVANLFVSQHGPVDFSLVLLRSIYFSIVTMTTLGFGDMYANANNYTLAAVCGHLLLGLQVILGYVLLGALVTRFGVLFTSGLIPGEFKN